MQGEQEDQDKSQKTEQPTSKRLEEARKKGNVPFSKEVNTFLMFLLISLLIIWIAPSLLRSATKSMSYYISFPGQIVVSNDNMTDVVRGVISILLKVVLFPVLLCFFAAIIGNLIQNGIMFIPDGFKFDLKRISILAGLKRIFSLNSIIELIKGFKDRIYRCCSLHDYKTRIKEYTDDVYIELFRCAFALIKTCNKNDDNNLRDCRFYSVIRFVVSEV